MLEQYIKSVFLQKVHELIGAIYLPIHNSMSITRTVKLAIMTGDQKVTYIKGHFTPISHQRNYLCLIYIAICAMKLIWL